MEKVRRCTRCIMDDRSDPYIAFDENGVCNYCRKADEIAKKIWFPNEQGQKKVEAMIHLLKEEGKGKKYDCLMGLSGGLDSSYLAYLGAAKWGLRIAAVHIDDGYDTEISKENIQKLCEKANIELIVITPDAEQYNALTKAYMKAGVPNLAVPQDNVLFAFLYAFARKNKIKYFLSGQNFSLESILQKGNTWSAYDLTNIRDIEKKFDDTPTDKLIFISSVQRMLDEHILGWKTICPLDYVDYTRDAAFQELYDFCGFEYYGRKHLENYLTAFIQLYWFPKKFNVDKRTSHLSSMIVSGQMTRDQALEELALPLYEEEYMEKVKDMLCEKMKMTREELESYVNAPGKQHDEYKTEKLMPLMRKVYHIFKPNRLFKAQ